MVSQYYLNLHFSNKLVRIFHFKEPFYIFTWVCMFMSFPSFSIKFLVLCPLIFNSLYSKNTICLWYRLDKFFSQSFDFIVFLPSIFFSLYVVKCVNILLPLDISTTFPSVFIWLPFLSFGSWSHLEFILAYGVKYRSNLSFLQVAFQLAQHHLLKSLLWPALEDATFNSSSPTPKKPQGTYDSRAEQTEKD